MKFAESQIFRKSVVGLRLEILSNGYRFRGNFNFNYQIGCFMVRGKTEMMISTFLDESYANPQNSIVIQNQLSRFMVDDG
jgi:hypothetical protein